jgi:hypothetical protein
MTDRDEQQGLRPENADEIPLGDLDVGDEEAANVVGGASATKDEPTESISLNFTKLGTTYTP